MESVLLQRVPVCVTVQSGIASAPNSVLKHQTQRKSGASLPGLGGILWSPMCPKITEKLLSS